MTSPETIRLEPSGRVPNSPLPVLLYRGVVAPEAAAAETRFRSHGWSNAWRNGIYRFHQFHSIAHEALACAQGRVQVRLGGDTGCTVVLAAGDIAVLPAGVGHRNEGGSDDLIIVGAYPGGCAWDLVRADGLDAASYAAAVGRITAVPRPRTDPVWGREGPLTSLWLAP